MDQQHDVTSYLRLLNNIYGCRDPKHTLYSGRDHDIKTFHQSYDEDEVTIEECDRAKAVLDKLFYADLLTDYCDAFPTRDGVIVFEWYVDEDHTLELELNSKYDTGHEKEMTFILTSPETKHTDSHGVVHHSEVITHIEFVEEVESKIRSFISKYSHKQDEQVS